jgi:hypothetical protein
MTYPNYYDAIFFHHDSFWKVFIISVFLKVRILTFKFRLFHFNKLSILLYLGYFLVYDVQRAYIIFKLPQ